MNIFEGKFLFNKFFSYLSLNENSKWHTTEIYSLGCGDSMQNRDNITAYDLVKGTFTIAFDRLY